jgi:hypothetical protein
MWQIFEDEGSNYLQLREHAIVLWNLLDDESSCIGSLLGSSESIGSGIPATNPHQFSQYISIFLLFLVTNPHHFSQYISILLFLCIIFFTFWKRMEFPWRYMSLYQGRATEQYNRLPPIPNLKLLGAVGPIVAQMKSSILPLSPTGTMQNGHVNPDMHYVFEMY